MTYWLRKGVWKASIWIGACVFGTKQERYASSCTITTSCDAPFVSYDMRTADTSCVGVTNKVVYSEKNAVTKTYGFNPMRVSHDIMSAYSLPQNKK
jgi:hypothetical protein